MDIHKISINVKLQVRFYMCKSTNTLHECIWKLCIMYTYAWV